MADERIIKLEEDLQALRQDIKELGGVFKDYASSQNEQFKEFKEEKFAQAKQTAQNASAYGKEQYQQAKQNVEQSIHEKPLQTAAVIAGVGFLIGFLLRGRH